MKLPNQLLFDMPGQITRKVPIFIIRRDCLRHHFQLIEVPCSQGSIRNKNNNMKKIYFILFGFILTSFQSFVFSQSKNLTQIIQQDSSKALKHYYQSYFPIVLSVSPQSLKGAEGKLILQQFNSLTPENVMKPGPIHPTEDHYNWAAADEIVNFAQANHLKMRGHTLCWHQQISDWFFKDANG